MRTKFLAVGSAFVLALASTLAAGCGAESVGVEEMPVSMDDTQIWPVDGGGLGTAPPSEGWYALTHVGGQPLPVADPYRTDGVQIVSGSMHLGSANDTGSNVFHYCLSDGNRYSAYFWYEPITGTTYPEYVLHVFPVSESGFRIGNVFTYNRYHTNPDLDPLAYTFDKFVERVC